MTEQYETIRVRRDGTICTIQIHRPEANNTINGQLTDEFKAALDRHRDEMTVLVVEGLPEVFCFGADFEAIERGHTAGRTGKSKSPETLYEVWLDMATGPYVSVAHVQGKANAGGIGFVAACDVVLADAKAVFSLSELLFGLMPAAVLPFLIRRIGFQKAHYMTLMTQPIGVVKAETWGLVDGYDEDSAGLLRRHLLRLRRLSKAGVTRYKRYMGKLNDSLIVNRDAALAANFEVFSDEENLAKIARYVRTGVFPWESS